MKLNILCDIFSMSGYASHGKQLALALHEQGHDIRIDCTRPENWQRIVTDFELNSLNKEYDVDRVSIMVEGKIMALDTPLKLKEQFESENMDEVFLKLARSTE